MLITQTVDNIYKRKAEAFWI